MHYSVLVNLRSHDLHYSVLVNLRSHDLRSSVSGQSLVSESQLLVVEVAPMTKIVVSLFFKFEILCLTEDTSIKSC